MPTALIVTALPHRLLVTLALMLSMDVQALTLGRVQGAALIGRPLEVAVQVQFDPEQNITGACFEADVFHADTRQNPGGVRVRLEPSATPNAAVLRITSNSPVDEPVVTLYVRAGCAQMSSRRYVLLADIVSEQAAVLPRVDSVPLVDGDRLAGPSATVAGAETPIAPPAALAQSGAQADTGGRPAVGNQPGAASGARRTERVESGSAAPARPAAAARVAPSAAPRAATQAAPRAAPQAAPRAAPPRRAAAPPAAAAATRGTGQSRLELDPLEVLSERVAMLESNAAAPVQLSEREAREIERLDRLDASVKALLALAERNEASLLDVRNRLEKAQADRFSNTVIYVLFGMLLLSLLAIAYLLARINRNPEPTGSRWFDAAPGSFDRDSLPPVPATRTMPAARTMPAGLGDSAATAGASPAPAAVFATAAPVAGSLPAVRFPIEPTQPMPEVGMEPRTGASHAQVDVSLLEMSESTFDRLMQSGSSHSAVRHVHPAVPMAVAQDVPMAVAQDALTPVAAPTGSGPRINADDLIDIRQRAEFFVTLGQTDQAVQVLETRIEQDAASCPQAFLDLFQLFHSLGLKADFNQLRGDFLQLFNARVPEFAGFDDEGRSLEDYPGAVDRLIRVWGRPAVLRTLEQMIYASPGAQAEHDAFDLAAFRDLLMLHAVAQTVRPDAAGGSGAFRPQSNTVGRGSQLDIDLSEVFTPDAVAQLVLPQTGAPAPASAGPAAGVDVDVSLDVVAPTQADTTPQQSGNLIDFDLGDIDVVRKPKSDS